MKASYPDRVLMLLENYTYPRDPRVHREAVALANAGYEVSVICPADKGQPWQETIEGVNVYRFQPAPSINGLAGYIWEYFYSTFVMWVISLFVFVNDGFDVVHAHNPPDTLFLIGAFYKLFGKRFVFDHHDICPELYRARFQKDGLAYKLLVLFEKLTCHFADHVIATNESYKKLEMERGGVPESHITVVRNGADLHRFRPAEPDPELRQMGKTIVGYVGIMGFQDGVDYLLRSLNHLLRDLGRTDFYCVILGTGDAWASMKALSHELGLDAHVRFTGRVSEDDLLRYMYATDICVAPDPRNPFTDRSTMIKMMDYMALAKPIVAFDLTEHRVSARDAAIYVPANDENAFASALAELMDDPARRKAMGDFGRRRIEEELAGHFAIPNLLRAYQSLSEPRANAASAARVTN